MNNLQKYVEYKLIQAFMNSEDIHYSLENNKDFINSQSFVDSLYAFVDKHVKTNQLDKEQLNNILQIVDHVKHNSNFCDTNKINEMIVAINSSNSKDELIYYIDNYVIRFWGHGVLKNLKNSKKRQEIKPIIKKCNYLDYYYLMLLTCLSDEDFLDLIEKAIYTECFLLSVNQIIYEYPKICEDITFYKRLKTIVEINLEAKDLIKTYEKGNLLVKRSKYYYKQLKEE